MADTKISELPSAGEITGVEIIPIVEDGATKQATVAELTSERVVDAKGYSINTSAIITESGTSRTLSSVDNGKIIYCTSSSAVTITTASGLGVGFSCSIIQAGTGQITIAQGSSTTLVNTNNYFKSLAQWSVSLLLCPVADTFILF